MEKIKNNFEKILLVDYSFDIRSLKDTKSEYSKIISFDYQSHSLLVENNIDHEISDNYISKMDLQKIQKKSYELSKWSMQKEINSLIEYEGINLGNLVHLDFADLIVSFIKKFFEVIKIFHINENCKFFTSGTLYDMISTLTSNVIKLESFNIIPSNDIVKHSYSLGSKSISINLTKTGYIRLKNISEYFLQLIFRFDKPKNSKKNILMVEFDPTKYKKFLFSANDLSQNIILYNRRRPTIWNFESFKVVKKSKCRIMTLKTLANNDLQNKINELKNKIKENLDRIWANDIFFSSFFSIDGNSFWISLKPIFVELVNRRIIDAVQEIEITKKLFNSFHIGSVLILSEIGFNEQIVMYIAKQYKVPIILIQHGMPYETVEAFERNNLSGFFPNFSDKMIVWGVSTQKYVENSGFNTSQITTLGNPVYDDLFDKKIDSKNSKHILLATSPPMKDLAFDNLVETNENYQNAIEKICNTATKLNKQLIIKLHPSLVDFDVESLVKKINPEILVIKSGSIFPFIKNCEVLITFDLSTTILEAQIFDKPTISIRLKDYGFGESEIFKTKSCVSVTMDNFDYTLQKILNDNNFKLQITQNGKDFLNYYLANKGNSSEQILKFLNEI